MRQRTVIAGVALACALASGACNRSEPAADRPATAEEREDPSIRERAEDTAELEKRAAELDQKLSEMQTTIKEENRAPTAALQEEVKEDVANAREAVAALKTTTAENWWERHERATERTLEDIEADVARFAKGTAAPAPAPAEPAGTTGSFDERRSAWVAKARARLDAMEERLRDVKTDAARETELQDTRARIDKLQDDLDRLRSVSADDWWDVSSARVREYIERVERSIGRLDNDRAAS